MHGKREVRHVLLVGTQILSSGQVRLVPVLVYGVNDSIEQGEQEDELGLGDVGESNDSVLLGRQLLNT